MSTSSAPNTPIRNITDAGHIYTFSLEGIPGVTIEVRVFQDGHSYGGATWQYVPSHWLHTPLQASAYTPSAPFATSRELALEKAASDYVMFYEAAVQKGLTPSADWLVPNSNYKDVMDTRTRRPR